MKHLQLALRAIAFFAFAAVMSSASCDLLGKADDVTFDVELTHVFNVNETADSKGSPVAYSHFELLDAATVNSDFNKFKDKIKSVTVNSITYTVSNYQSAKSVTFKNGQVGFSSASATSASVLAAVSSESLQAIQGQEKTLPIDQSGVNTVADLIKNDKKINIYTIGTLSETPVKFDVTVKLECTIVANAL